MEGDGGRGGERGTGLEQEERWIAKVFFLPSTGLVRVYPRHRRRHSLLLTEAVVCVKQSKQQIKNQNIFDVDSAACCIGGMVPTSTVSEGRSIAKGGE